MAPALYDQTSALQQLLTSTLNKVGDMDPDSEGYHSLKDDVYRSVELFASMQTSLAEWERHWQAGPQSETPTRKRKSQEGPEPSPGSVASTAQGDISTQDQGESDGPALVKKAKTGAKDVQERATLLLKEHPGDVSLPLSTLLNTVVKFREGKYSAKATDAACARLFNLYASVDDESVGEYLDGAGLPHSEWAVILAGCKAADRASNIEQKLTALSQLAVNQDSGSRLVVWVTRMLNTVVQLKFAVEWSRQNKADKKKYINARFLAEEAQSISRVSHSADGQNLCKKLENDFRSKFDKMVLARNSTLRLFQTFGANVIAEPLFQLVPQGSLPMNGKNLKELTSYLIQNRLDLLSERGILQRYQGYFSDVSEDLVVACQEYVDSCHASTALLLVRVVSHVAGKELGEYLEDFLDERSEMGSIEFD